MTDKPTAEDIIRMREYAKSVAWSLAPGDGNCTMSMESLCDLALSALQAEQPIGDSRDLRNSIAEILVRNNLRADQVAIIEIARLVGAQPRPNAEMRSVYSIASEIDDIYKNPNKECASIWRVEAAIQSFLSAQSHAALPSDAVAQVRKALEIARDDYLANGLLLVSKKPEVADMLQKRADNVDKALSLLSQTASAGAAEECPTCGGSEKSHRDGCPFHPHAGITGEAYANGYKDGVSELIPKGYKLVPVEPTRKMLEAAANAPDDDDYLASMIKLYKAMLSAAPSATRKEG